MTEVLDAQTTRQLTIRAEAALRRFGALPAEPGDLPAHTPITGGQLTTLRSSSPDEVDAAIGRAATAFRGWRGVPAPVRAGVVRRLGQLLTTHKSDLAELVTLEAGKIPAEAEGEVQEMIDICEFAVGLSRQLYGHTMPSERPGHRLMETWHPLGVVGVISAFNFPVAVWAWNTAIALVCGDTVVWKPSETTPLTALACHALLRRATGEVGADPEIHQLIQGGSEAGSRLVDDSRVALVSATGSVRMGRLVALTRWRRGWPSGSGAACWSWAATTARSSPRPPISTSRRGRSCSRRRARPGSGAPRCGD
jgi:aldehyde dehydrogenase (NAD+)